VALLRFYGDAGGKRQKTNVAVAGYVATLDQWNKWRSQWKPMLDREGVECFHRNEMEPPFYREFRKKGWDKKHQVEVLNRLHRIIKATTLKGVGYSVRNKAFSQIMPPKVKRDLGGPYGWCVQLCIIDIGTWARDRGDWVHYIFESGDDGEGQISTALRSLQKNEQYRDFFRIADYSFSDKRGPNAVMELQAADFIAYESYKQVDNYLIASGRKMRLSANDLIRKGTDTLACWGDRALMNWLARAVDYPNITDSLVKRGPRPTNFMR
jgi:hypothetical protein